MTKSPPKGQAFLENDEMLENKAFPDISLWDVFNWN